ncbi:methylmalonyl Co-A mutase-associated GTPase MeaB [bacterium]|nr:methylmalonyl Co-A mutase-associated GTPase MeaB [bacterium]
MPGKSANHDGFPNSNLERRQDSLSIKRRNLSVEDYVQGILTQDKTILARAITLIESNSQKHLDFAQEVIKQILPKTGNAIRVGISGVPGAGKSTFIEKFGLYLLSLGHKVAVLAIDPTSSVTKGSILGDKTRMELLSREQDCFIRPSPSSGSLGGVTRKTRESILLCEAFGFDVILVETVGVGQNEVTVRDMVDFFLLLQIAGAGDELQGIKKGVIEISDAIVVNKADGDNVSRAKLAQGEYSTALHYLAPSTPGWHSRAFTCSALTGEGLEDVWKIIMKFKEITNNNGCFAKRRNNQIISWVNSMIKEYLISSFYQNKNVKAQMPEIQKNLLSGDITPTNAVDYLLKLYNH